MPVLDVRFAHPDLLCLDFVTLSTVPFSLTTPQAEHRYIIPMPLIYLEDLKRPTRQFWRRPPIRICILILVRDVRIS